MTDVLNMEVLNADAEVAAGYVLATHRAMRAGCQASWVERAYLREAGVEASNVAPAVLAVRYLEDSLPDGVSDRMVFDLLTTPGDANALLGLAKPEQVFAEDLIYPNGPVKDALATELGILNEGMALGKVPLEMGMEMKYRLLTETVDLIDLVTEGL